MKYTMFNRIIHFTKKLSNAKKEQGTEIARCQTVLELLDFCVENQCFSQKAKEFLAEGILQEKNTKKQQEKILLLYDAIGIE